MKKTELNKKEIEALLPHREPMLLIDKLINIIHLKSATAIMYVKKNDFYVQGHFPNQPVMPGVLIVEAFGQAAAALTAYGIDPKEYANKLVRNDLNQLQQSNQNPEGMLMKCCLRTLDTFMKQVQSPFTMKRY